jgi:hypothetical protein
MIEIGLNWFLQKKQKICRGKEKGTPKDASFWK